MASEVAQIDKKYLNLIRENVSSFIRAAGEKHDKQGLVVLDVAPQDHEGAKPYFKTAQVETLDIDPKSGATYIADLCADNSAVIPAEHFDIVICTEVLEHTLQPFDAVKELHRVLKPGGYVYASSPFNFRVHGPLPDCWRFTEHGWRALFSEFEVVELTALEAEDRFLAPIHHTVIARKKT